MDFSKYTTFSFNDFLDDDAFLRFIIEQNPEDIEAWEKFNQENPKSGKIASAAFNTITTFRQQKTFYNDVEQTKTFERITKTIALKTPVRKINKLSFFLKIAAVFAVVFISVILYNNFFSKEIQSTDFGKIKTIILPDGSEVILNGNSKITYSKNFDKGAREVWISGEAFFNVKHLNIDTNNIKPEEKFIVHCSDLNIEVLGTTFNVRNRHGKSSVGLLSGKIRIDYETINKSKAQFVMAPGDFINHAEGKRLQRQKFSDPERLTAWIDHKLVFKNATLSEMSAVLQDDLGYNVKLNEQLSKLKIEGEINVNNVNDLIGILSRTLHLNIETKDKTITIKE